MSVHPVAQLALHGGDVRRSVAQQRRGHHRGIGADHQRLDDVGAGGDAGRRGQRDGGSELGPQDGDPAQGEPQLPRTAQLDAGDDVEGVDVEVGLVEAIEQHEPVGTGGFDARRKVGHGRVVRTELHRERDADLSSDRGDDIEVRGFHVGRAAVRVGSHVVQVQFEGVGAGVGDELGVADPSSGGSRVEAADDGHRRAGLHALEIGEVALAGVREVVDGGEVVERLGEMLRARFQGAVELDLLVQDLLFEQ